MTTKEFIEKAIEGGYVNIYLNPKSPHEITPLMIQEKYMIFLDPKAWQAVGKVEDWIDIMPSWEKHKDGYYLSYEGWQWNMHRMIDALCEGKSIEEFLSTL